MEEHSGYYTHDLSKVSIGQLLRHNPLPMLFKPLFVMAFYFFRWRAGNSLSAGMPWPEKLVLVPNDDVPHDVLDKFVPFFRFCAEAGFTLQSVSVNFEIGPGSNTIYSASLLDPTGLIWAAMSCTAWTARSTLTLQESQTFLSSLPDGTLLRTTHGNPNQFVIYPNPPHWRVNSLPLTSDFCDLLAAHRARLDELDESPRQFCSESLKDFLLSEARAVVNHGLTCGGYRWLSKAEVEVLRKASRR